MPIEPPRPSLPSLNALRAFEAAARHESFVKAAGELHVTAAAVAQQVRILEEWVGQPLFERLPQGLRLTREARAIVPRMTGAFDRLGLAVQALRAINRPMEVRIAALPAVAMLWLSPRLRRLGSDFPNLSLSVSALEQPPNFRRDLYDLALFFVEDEVAGARALPLLDDVLFPVCSPHFVATGRPLQTPSDLTADSLLHDSVWHDDWPRWLRYAGEAEVHPVAGMTFSLYSLALQAAIDGSGILMGHAPLVASALNDGSLIPLFDIRMPSSAPLTLLVPEEPELRDRLAELVTWFQEEAAQASLNR